MTLLANDDDLPCVCTKGLPCPDDAETETVCTEFVGLKGEPCWNCNQPERAHFVDSDHGVAA